MFARMRQQHSENGGPANTDGAEAMAAVLEMVRNYEVHPCCVAVFRSTCHVCLLCSCSRLSSHGPPKDPDMTGQRAQNFDGPAAPQQARYFRHGTGSFTALLRLPNMNDTSPGCSRGCCRNAGVIAGAGVRHSRVRPGAGGLVQPAVAPAQRPEPGAVSPQKCSPYAPGH